MQTPEQEHNANIIRLRIYQEKLTPEQQQRARVACRVTEYCDQLGLNIAQRYTAVKLALGQLQYGLNEDAACRIGIKAAHIIAVAGANQKIPCIRKRLH